MRVPDFEVRSNSHFLNVLALFFTDYSLISKHSVSKFTRMDRNWPNYPNRLLLFLLLAQFFSYFKYTCTD